MVSYTILGVPYYNYSIMDPKTPFESLRPLSYVVEFFLGPTECSHQGVNGSLSSFQIQRWSQGLVARTLQG